MPHRVCEDRVLAADTLMAVRKSEMKLPAPTQRCTYLLGGELLSAAIRPRSKKSVIYGCTTPDFSVSGEAAASPRGWACENSAVVYFEPDAVRVNTPLVIMAPECVPGVSLRRRTPGHWLTWVEPAADRVAALSSK